MSDSKNKNKWRGHPQRLRAIGKRDAHWSELARREEEIEQLKERGFETESDVELMINCLVTVLAELKWRKAEMLAEQLPDE